ncbi:hypothetical protein [Pseudomonas sp. W5-36]|uniref:hypothetical protein n=1 Tax=Pseudomonas sp. W5-36 TaxID=3097455 RepID=UPI00397ABED6
MRKLILVALATAISSGAHAAEWKKFVPTAYVLSPAEDAHIVAMANLNGDAFVVNLVDLSGSFCKESQNSDVSPAGPYKVNGQNLKFIQACISGNRILSPETPKGKQFLASAITSAPATVELDLGVVLHFASEDFDSAKKAMLDTKSAM